MSNIPNGPDGITCAWMSNVTGWDVDEVTVTQIGVGVGVSSALYRAVLGGTGCPESVIVKLAALAPEAVQTAAALGFYRREVNFFEELRSNSPVRVPSCHFTEIDDDNASFVIVMEDFGGNRMVDQVAGMELADVESAVAALADWHATWWNRVDGFSERGLAVPLGSPIYPAVLPTIFTEGWDKLSAEAPHVLEPFGEIGPKFVDAIAGLLQQLDAAPNTLLHGDYRADNMMFDSDGNLLLLDFQILGTGAAAYDLAYLVTQSPDASVASANERALFNLWTARLAEGGVPVADLARAWDDYRTAALFCLIYPVGASRGMDLTDQRQLRLLETMTSRLGRAVAELDLAELI